MLVADKHKVVAAYAISATAAILAGTAAATTLILQQHATNAVVASNILKIASLANKPCRRQGGRYRRQGKLHSPRQSFWQQLNSAKSDGLDFLHFTSFDMQSFTELVQICSKYITTDPLEPQKNQTTPSSCHLHNQQFSACDIMAMTLHYLLSTAGNKDLHVQFGVTAATFICCVNLGINAIMCCILKNKYAKLHWDHSLEALDAAAQKTSAFFDIPNAITMIDGTKLCSLSPSNHLEQNSDYNDWTKEVNQNMALIWDPHGKILAAAVNLPKSFHDTASSWWCGIYNYIQDLPLPYKVVCDDVFYKKGNLEGNLVKTKEKYLSNDHIWSAYDQSLTNL